MYMPTSDLANGFVAAMPDIAHESQAAVQGCLDHVGMSGVEIPVRFKQTDGSILMLPANGDVFVSLDLPEAKGIHMSRLFLTLEELLSDNNLDASLIEYVLRTFIESHRGLSKSSHLRLHFELPIKRPALKSEYSGWRQYPVSIGGNLKNGQLTFSLTTRVTYSSTCPCSAALARQLIQDQFRTDFAGHRQVDLQEVIQWLGRDTSIMATPHSQRSHADVSVVYTDGTQVPRLEELIDGVEGVLQTAVQAAVKREDEQEFARLNGRNLMFCEDACRRVKHALEHAPGVVDYRIRVAHLESLHPHDAVSIVTKGVPGGLRHDSN
jgi:GTP cyclohydrolase IB